MAFVYRSERVIDLSPERNELGPGQYIVVDKGNSIAENKAPFLSKSIKSQPPKKDDALGPGQYYRDEKMIQIQKFIQSSYKEPVKVTLLDTFSKEIKSHLPDKLGFLVKDNRFKKIEKEELPGPGYYYKDKVKSKMNKKNTLKRIEHKTDIHRITSIPGKNYFGYEIDPNGDAVMKTDPDKEIKHLGKGDNKIGPGQYNLDKPNDWIKKGTSEWEKSKNKTMSKRSEQPEVVINYRDYSTIKKMQKERLVNVMTERQERQKEMMKMMNMEKDNYSLVEKQMFMDTPGPGYYHNNDMMSAFRPSTVPEKFQAFGRSTERFGPRYDDENIGPGTYFKDELSKRHRNRLNSSSTMDKSTTSKKNFGFNSTTTRWRENKKVNEVSPGPGSYANFDDTRKTFTATGCFGSMEKRFIERKEALLTPGPGEYQFKTNRPNIDVMRKMLKKPEKTFTSTAIKDEIPSVGTYNPDAVLTIQYKVNKNAANNNNYDNTYEATKFKCFDQKKSKDDSILGPGYYYREKKVKHKQINPAFNSKDNRFREKSFQTVGPGNYNHSTYFDWNKKSYNILFL
jgi:hypothetical protein